MVNINTNNASRDQVLRLIEEKDRIEREIQDLHSVLATNNVGMTDSLVDAEGFPRNDIDVYRVRHARHRIICLQNDHKELMKLIERGLHNLHADYLGAPGDRASSQPQDEQMEVVRNSINPSTNGHTNGHSITSSSESNGYHHPDLEGVVQGTNELRVDDTPFVQVNFVSDGSPAFTAGLQEGDEITRFGSLTSRNFSNLSQIAVIVQHSVGAPLEVRVRRGNDNMNFSLVPNAWSGRGLLGCNVVPI